MKKVRNLLILLLAAMTLTVFIGCDGNNPEPTPEPGPREEFAFKTFITNWEATKENVKEMTKTPIYGTMTKAELDKFNEAAKGAVTATIKDGIFTVTFANEEVLTQDAEGTWTFKAIDYTYETFAAAWATAENDPAKLTTEVNYAKISDADLDIFNTAGGKAAKIYATVENGSFIINFDHGEVLTQTAKGWTYEIPDYTYATFLKNWEDAEHNDENLPLTPNYTKMTDAEIEAFKAAMGDKYFDKNVSKKGKITIFIEVADSVLVKQGDKGTWHHDDYRFSEFKKNYEAGTLGQYPQYWFMPEKFQAAFKTACEEAGYTIVWNNFGSYAVDFTETKRGVQDWDGWTYYDVTLLKDMGKFNGTDVTGLPEKNISEYTPDQIAAFKKFLPSKWSALEIDTTAKTFSVKVSENQLLKQDAKNNWTLENFELPPATGTVVLSRYYVGKNNDKFIVLTNNSDDYCELSNYKIFLDLNPTATKPNPKYITFKEGTRLASGKSLFIYNGQLNASAFSNITGLSENNYLKAGLNNDGNCVFKTNDISMNGDDALELQKKNAEDKFESIEVLPQALGKDFEGKKNIGKGAFTKDATTGKWNIDVKNGSSNSAFTDAIVTKYDKLDFFK